MVGSEKERAEPSEGGWGTKGDLQYIEIKQLKKYWKCTGGIASKNVKRKKEQADEVGINFLSSSLPEPLRGREKIGVLIILYFSCIKR